MVKIDMERTNLARRIYDLRLEANAAWGYCMRRPHTMAADIAERAAMEADEEAYELLEEYARKYGCLPHGIRRLG